MLTLGADHDRAHHEAVLVNHPVVIIMIPRRFRLAPPLPPPPTVTVAILARRIGTG
jgi:hypothetical protein